MARRIQYGQLMHKAMRALISDVLADVAEHGLPGEHHFVITFDTAHPGVDMPARVRQNYVKDGEMTIIMRNWFDNLAVMPDRFAVTLSFGGQPEPLVIPFDAITTFVDPSVEFGLRFDGHEDELEAEEDEAQAPETPEPTDEPSASDASKSGEVVSLDTFRKH